MTDPADQPIARNGCLASATVIVLTYRWPFTEKAEFMRDEWAAWLGAKRVVIISVAASHEQSLQLAANCVARSVAPVGSVFDRLKYLLSAILHFPFFAELWRLLRRGPTGFLARIRTLGVYLQGAERYRRGIAAALAEWPLAEDESLVLYSYWFGAATHAAITLQRMSPLRRSIVITRMHGSDLYEHANPENYLPYRSDLLQEVQAAYAISENGAQYAITHWACPAFKMHVSRLGTVDHFKGRYPERASPFTVLSCSYINYLKRVDMIAEAIANLRGCPIRWIHVGGGPGEGVLRDRCEQLFRDRHDIAFEMPGSLPHDRTIDLLQTTNINVVVNASLSEGIPVSMMEAHCCGIPVIGPNVGGVSEIVDSGVNGRLLEPPLTPQGLAAAMQSLIDMDPAEYATLCRQARVSWESRFFAAPNYRQFVDSVVDNLCETNP